MPGEKGEDEGGEAKEDHEITVDLAGVGFVFEVVYACGEQGIPGGDCVEEQIESDVAHNEEEHDRPFGKVDGEQYACVVEIFGGCDDRLKNEDKENGQNHNVQFAQRFPPDK